MTITPPPPTSRPRIDAALIELKAHKDSWAASGIEERLKLLAQVLADLCQAGWLWVQAEMQAKASAESL